MPDLVARLNAALEGRYAIEILRRRRSSITSVPSALAMMLALFATPLAAQANPAQEEGRSLRIGIIGSGAMGAPIGAPLGGSRASGHVLVAQSRTNTWTSCGAPRRGPARATPMPPPSSGRVILLAVPPSAIPQLGEDLADLMRGKVVIDLTNPRVDRDGPISDEWLEMGTGLAMAQYLPGVRLVKALNTVNPRSFRDPIRDGERIGVPIAGDDDEAVAITAALVRDVGLDPVIVGSAHPSEGLRPGKPRVWRRVHPRERYEKS